LVAFCIVAKWLYLLPWGSDVVFKNAAPLRIDTISKVVPHVVVVLVDCVVERWRFPITKSPEQGKSLENIDVVVRTRHAKESMPNPQVH